MRRASWRRQEFEVSPLDQHAPSLSLGLDRLALAVMPGPFPILRPEFLDARIPVLGGLAPRLKELRFDGLRLAFGDAFARSLE